MTASTDSLKFLLPEPFDGTGDIGACITQFGLLSSLQSWVKPILDDQGNQRKDAQGRDLFTDKRHQIFPLRLRGSAIEFYHSLSDQTKSSYDALIAEFERQYLEPPEFFRGSLRKRVQGESEKPTEFLADLKLLAKKAYPADSQDVKDHLVLQAFIEGLYDQRVRLELRKNQVADLDGASKMANHLDAILRLEPKSSGSIGIGSSHSGQPIVGSIDKLVTRVDEMMDKISVGQINTGSRSRQRYQGSKPKPRNRDNKYRQSPKPNSSGGTNQSRSQSRSASRSPGKFSQSPSNERQVRFNKDVVCYGCNRKGHLKNECNNCWNCGSSSHTRRNCPRGSKR